MVEKRMRLMAAFGWDERYVKWGMTGAKTWVAYCWAFENENTVWGKGVTRSTDGYLKQEINRILKEKENGKG